MTGTSRHRRPQGRHVVIRTHRDRDGPSLRSDSDTPVRWQRESPEHGGIQWLGLFPPHPIPPLRGSLAPTLATGRPALHVQPTPTLQWALSLQVAPTIRTRTASASGTRYPGLRRPAPGQSRSRPILPSTPHGPPLSGNGPVAPSPPAILPSPSLTVGPALPSGPKLETPPPPRPPRPKATGTPPALSPLPLSRVRPSPPPISSSPDLPPLPGTRLEGNLKSAAVSTGPGEREQLGRRRRARDRASHVRLESRTCHPRSGEGRGMASQRRVVTGRALGVWLRRERWRADSDAEGEMHDISALPSI